MEMVCSLSTSSSSVIKMLSKHLLWEPMMSKSTTTSTTLIFKYFLSTIILGPILIVGQYLIRLTNILKHLFGLFLILILVRVPFERQFTVGRFDLLLFGIAWHAEDFVVVLFLALFQCDFSLS